MSSAILYVAIVAIWACVLIPRWLRHSPSVAENTAEEYGASSTGPPVAESTEFSADGFSADPVEVDVAEVDVAEVDVAEVAAAEFSDDELSDDEPDEGSPPPRAPLTREESRRRMLAARRRLLILLASLEVAACALPLLGLAALWVIFPPTVMLLGYTLLLREASKADRERAERDSEALARAHGRTGSRAATAAPSASAPSAPSASAPSASAPPASAAPAAPAYPEPEDYEDLGHARDYAPGLAGKYTTSNADVTDPAEYPEYKRAVGD